MHPQSENLFVCRKSLLEIFVWTSWTLSRSEILEWRSFQEDLQIYCYYLLIRGSSHLFFLILGTLSVESIKYFLSKNLSTRILKSVLFNFLFLFTRILKSFITNYSSTDGFSNLFTESTKDLHRDPRTLSSEDPCTRILKPVLLKDPQSKKWPQYTLLFNFELLYMQNGNSSTS